MNNLGSYLLANVYSAFSPTLNTASAVCYSNGLETPCPVWTPFLGIGMVTFWLVFLVIMLVAMWKVFTKAGQPGWASIIPIYNLVVMLHIAKKPGWWVILAFIPFINLIVGLIVVYNLAKMFGKGFGFTLGLLLLPFIFYPILGFGSSRYVNSTPTQVV